MLGKVPTCFKLTQWLPDAVGEGVSIVAWPASAGGDVTLHAAVGIGAANAGGAGVDAFVCLACFSYWAVGMCVAF